MKKNHLVLKFVRQKLQNHNINTHQEFIDRCYDYFTQHNTPYEEFYDKVTMCAQSVKGNIKMSIIHLEFIIVQLLHDKIDDPEICQLINIGKGTDIRGKRFGSLVVTHCLGINDSDDRLLWLCKCDCGNSHRVESRYLRDGSSSSCGCKRQSSAKERMLKMAVKHGLSNSPEYITYINLKMSCYNQNHPRYKNYGAKGIVLCDSWKESFLNFYNDMGKRPEKAVFRRYDSTKNFTPDNCYWHVRK